MSLKIKKYKVKLVKDKMDQLLKVARKKLLLNQLLIQLKTKRKRILMALVLLPQLKS